VSKARLVITAVVVEGRPVREVSAAYGVARSWIYELLERYRSDGEAAFEPRSRWPYSQPTAIPAATVELILRLRHQLTRQGLDAGPQTIAWHLAEQYQLTVSEATNWRKLQQAGLIVPEPKKKPKSAYICFAAEQPNEMWQVDFTHYRLSRPDGTPGADAEILCFLDDHSRYALSVTCHQPVTGPVVVAVFRQNLADQGIPVSVLSDIQRHGLHHPLRRRPRRTRHHQRLLRRTTPPGRDPKAFPTEPSHHLRQGGAVPPNVEEMAHIPAPAAANPGRAAIPLQHLHCLLQQLSAAPFTEPAHPLGCLPGKTESRPAGLNRS